MIPFPDANVTAQYIREMGVCLHHSSSIRQVSKIEVMRWLATDSGRPDWFSLTEIGTGVLRDLKIADFNGFMGFCAILYPPLSRTISNICSLIK